MLQLSRSLLSRSVMSLRTNRMVAQTIQAIINPNNLKIEGFYCDDKLKKRIVILLSQDIRDIIAQGIVINDHEVLADPGELVRLQETLNLQFELLGKTVVTTQKERLGKVNDYAADGQTFYIQKIYVGQNLLKSLSGGQLSVDRNQIVEITNKKIIIKPPLRPVKAGVPAVAPLAS